MTRSKKYQVARIAHGIVVDLLGNACGVDYSWARTKAKSKINIVEGVEIPCAGKKVRAQDAYLRNSESGH